MKKILLLLAATAAIAHAGDLDRLQAQIDAVAAVETDVLYQWKNFPTHEVRVTPITDLVVRNVAVERANRLLMLKGDARCPIRNVTVENVTCGTTYAKDIVANAEGVTVR